MEAAKDSELYRTHPSIFYHLFRVGWKDKLSEQISVQKAYGKIVLGFLSSPTSVNSAFFNSALEYYPSYRLPINYKANT